MSRLQPDQEVTLVSVSGASVVHVIEDRGDVVLVRDSNGKRREVRRSRLTTVRAEPTRTPLASRPNYDLGGGRAVVKELPTRNERYLAFVREHDCCACGADGPSDPHHWALKGKGGGMGTKADDFRTVPLCRACHDYYHAHGNLPENTTIMTRILFLAKQVDLLVKWATKEGKTR